ncbi:hypothetical protein H7I41_21640 [Mycobacterium manitobense]|uniref:Uncharacterized protein n=1 Tax=[Mycobacterium] manitobense TaxID=190147 RepID=A0A9X2YRE4_9MYCO|nr:hypothetical protein [[Mycobacterium] manitobense]MCV7172524.1 hypothetical protein [[Mycobacterium] manitobense]
MSTYTAVVVVVAGIAIAVYALAARESLMLVAPAIPGAAIMGAQAVT